MQIDARTLNNHEIVHSDVCVIGAGPAGTTLAQEFLDSGVRVALLESGGTRADHRTQQLSSGTLSGDLYEPVEQTHLRQLGGTANHWIIKMADKQYGYRYVPLDEIDFEPREGMPFSGWPIRRADLDPYYARVHAVCGIGPYEYGIDGWQGPGALPLQLDPAEVVTNVFMFGPTSKFTQEFPARFARSDNVDTYLHATVVELLTDADGNTVEQAVVRTFEGKTLYFKARQFVIAANAYQTPRLLLNSRRVHANGIGNQHDAVGRYYMDHSMVPSGNFYPHDPRIINTLALYDMRLIRGASVLGKLALAPEIMRREGLRNFTATLFPMPEFKDVDALVSVKEIASQLAQRQVPKEFGRHAANLWRGKWHLLRVLYEKLRYDTPIMPGFGRGGWSRLGNNDRKYPRLELLAFAEQSPNPNNRVTLIEEKDELGCPKIKAHFKWDAEDLHSIRRAQDIMSRVLVRTGLGRYEPPSRPDGELISVLGLHHMMGTTRMSDDPRHGVVDRDCRVHGVSNLYVAGSAVFTTGGYANPTLTNLAISIRVADRVKQALGARTP